MKHAQTKITASRSKNRMNYDIDTIYSVLDAAHACTISFTVNGEPRALPTGHVRINDRIYIHGSVKSHFFDKLCKAETVCITAFLLDGIVLAKSGFNHSFNYRSVVVFGSPEPVEGCQHKDEILAGFTERYVPGRWDQTRKPTPKELDATSVIGFRIEEASVKIRQGPPNDAEKDKNLPIWSGVLPIEARIMEPIPDDNCKLREVPDYIRALYK
jgi:uncharacterized protein